MAAGPALLSAAGAEVPVINVSASISNNAVIEPSRSYEICIAVTFFVVAIVPSPIAVGSGVLGPCSAAASLLSPTVSEASCRSPSMWKRAASIRRPMHCWKLPPSRSAWTSTVASIGTKRNPYHPFSTFDTATLGGLAFGQTVLARAAQAAGLAWNHGEAHSAVYDAERTAELFCRIVNLWEQFRDSGEDDALMATHRLPL